PTCPRLSLTPCFSKVVCLGPNLPTVFNGFDFSLLANLPTSDFSPPFNHHPTLLSHPQPSIHHPSSNLACRPPALGSPRPSGGLAKENPNCPRVPVPDSLGAELNLSVAFGARK